MNLADPTRSAHAIGNVAVVEVAPDNTDRPPIVMVHGGCHSAWCWEQAQSWFADQGWRSVALDWLSRGRSAQLPEEDWLARDIVAVREEVGAVCAALAEETGKAPVVMGHSMGGLATLAHAALSDQEIAALVLT